MRRYGLRASLCALTAIMAVFAFGGGFYGLLTGAPVVPREWLLGTPFQGYRIPSLILFFVVGGSSALAAYANLKWAFAKRFTLAAALIQLGWIAVQVMMIGFVSWLQPAVALWALITLALAARLPRTEDTVK